MKSKYPADVVKSLIPTMDAEDLNLVEALVIARRLELLAPVAIPLPSIEDTQPTSIQGINPTLEEVYAFENKNLITACDQYHHRVGCTLTEAKEILEHFSINHSHI